jgi:hypothetical protein
LRPSGVLLRFRDVEFHLHVARFGFSDRFYAW